MTQVYTRGISSDFPNGLAIDQLMAEINNVMSVPILSINIDSGVANLIFASQIEDEDQLNTIIENHVPITRIYTKPYIVNDVITHSISGDEYSYFGNQSATIVISKGTQGQFTSIKEAILANNYSNNIFIVYPGTYVEDNPIVLPTGTSLIAAGTAANSIIVAANPGSNLIVTSVGTKIFGFTLYGAKTTGSIGIYFDGSTVAHGKFSVLGECFIYDCDIGVESDGKNTMGIADTLYADKLIIGAQTQSLSKGIYCHNRGSFIGTTCYVFGVPGYFTIGYGIYCDANSKISLAPASVWFANVGIYLNSGGETELSLLTLNSNNTAVYVGPDSPDIRISANSLAISSSITYDMDIHATTANIEIYSSVLDDSKINNPNKLNMNVKYNAHKFGSYYQAILGDMQLGSVNNPSKLSIGEGLYVNTGVVVYSNDNLESGTWVDNTIGASSFNSPAFDLFQDVGPDNCLYIGSDNLMYGLKIHLTVATSSTVTLEDTIWEYWNGTTWVVFNIMQTFTDNPCYTYTNSFMSSASKFHIRFGLTTVTPFVAKTLNSVSKNWVRLKIVNALPSIPIAEYFKLHTNTCIINSDGFTEYFGNARIIKNLPMGYNTFSANSSPSDQELFIADNISVGRTKNKFNTGILTRLGFCTNLPIDVDISFPIKLNLAFVCDSNTAGDIYWTLRYSMTHSNDNVYLNTTDAPTDAPNAQVVTKTTTLTTNKNNMDLREVIYLDIHTISTFPPDNNNPILWVTLERDGTNASDTYGGSASLSLLSSTYISWNNGAHILGF